MTTLDYSDYSGDHVYDHLNKVALLGYSLKDQVSSKQSMFRLKALQLEAVIHTNNIARTVVVYTSGTVFINVIVL